MWNCWPLVHCSDELVNHPHQFFFTLTLSGMDNHLPLLVAILLLPPSWLSPTPPRVRCLLPLLLPRKVWGVWRGDRGGAGRGSSAGEKESGEGRVTSSALNKTMMIDLGDDYSSCKDPSNLVFREWLPRWGFFSSTKFGCFEELFILACFEKRLIEYLL